MVLSDVALWKSECVSGDEARTVWDRLREYASTQTAPFTSQEVLTWFRRHAPLQANDRTVRTHIRGACWNVGDRSQFTTKEPFLTKIDRGLFRRATPEEIDDWRRGIGSGPVSAGWPRIGRHSEESSNSDTTISSGVVSRDAPGELGSASYEWHTEANVQAMLVTALAANDWSILTVANTATKEPGVDVIASRDEMTVGIEVKGFPSRAYADPARAQEQKRTSPSTQAGHWYSQAVLAAMRLRGKEPGWRSVIALPDFPRYRILHTETTGSLVAAEIEVWWVDEAGSLRES